MPGHTNILGKERPDVLAMLGAYLPPEAMELDIFTSLSEIFQRLKQISSSNLIKAWNELESCI